MLGGCGQGEDTKEDEAGSGLRDWLQAASLEKELRALNATATPLQPPSMETEINTTLAPPASIPDPPFAKGLASLRW